MSPARQPGAGPPAGGSIAAAATPARVSSQETIEFEFHISPAPSSSRPQTALGTRGTSSSSRLAHRVARDGYAIRVLNRPHRRHLDRVATLRGLNASAE